MHAWRQPGTGRRSKARVRTRRAYSRATIASGPSCRAVEMSVETASGSIGAAVQRRAPRGAGEPGGVVAYDQNDHVGLSDALVHLDALRRARRGRRWVGLGD